MANGLMGKKVLTSKQQQLVGDMNEIAQHLSATAADTTLSPEKRRDLMTGLHADYRGKRGELAADLFESHALASGFSPRRIQLVQEVQKMRDSLQQVVRDPRLTQQERRTVIDSHADYFRQKMKELRSADDAPQGGIETLKNIPGQIGNRLDELSGSLQKLPAVARQKLDEWTRPQNAGPNPQAANAPATEAVEPFLF